jgi:integrase
MKRTLEVYMGGKTLGEVVEALGTYKTQVYCDLREIEAAVKCQIMRGRHGRSISTSSALRADTSVLRTNRGGSSRRASVRDFHSFRVTWVTLALTAGVPLELVQKVTGHRTTDIVLKHYFQPGQEDFRRTLQAAMPKLLMNGQKTPKEEVLEICKAVTVRAWKKDVARIAALVEGM